MPKEAKKFINPLLRPSQPLEPRQGPAVEQEERPPSARKSSGMSTVVMPEISPARPTSVQIEVSPPVVPLSDQVDVPLVATVANVVEELTEPQLTTLSSTLNETAYSQPQSASRLTEETDVSGVDMGIKETDFLTTTHKPIAGRRRRGELSFEKTHERITIWIDKQLKQAFEELAYQRELPKTALLNEAVADLLRKYGID